MNFGQQAIIGQANGVGCAQGGQIYPAYGGYGGQFSIIGATDPPTFTDKVKTFLDEENSLIGVQNKWIIGTAAVGGLLFWAKSARLF